MLDWRCCHFWPIESDIESLQRLGNPFKVSVLNVVAIESKERVSDCYKVLIIVEIRNSPRDIGRSTTGLLSEESSSPAMIAPDATPRPRAVVPTP